MSKITALYLTVLPSLAFSASQTFITQGPAPSKNSFWGENNSDVGTVGPIAVSPTDSNTLFIGGCNGGIWRTTNFGSTWIPLTDNKTSLSISSLAFDPTDGTSNTLLAGTGSTSNGAVGGFADFFRSGPLIGVLYTTDGGNTWNGVPGNTSLTQTVSGVAARGATLLAATFEFTNPSVSGAAYGLFRSTDTGSTFTKVSFPSEAATSPVTSLVGDPANSSNLWAAVTDSTIKNNTALFASTDTGATWTPIFGAAQSAGLIQASTQTLLKVAKGPGNTLAVLVADVISDKIMGVFWSGNNGATWTQVFNFATATIDFNPSGQAVINSTLAIDPVNSNIVYVGGTYDNDPANGFPLAAYSFDSTMPINTATSFIEGASSTFSHPDVRLFVFDGAGNLLVSNDGGLFQKNPPSSGAWTSINGNLSLMQNYSTGYDANNNILFSAAQDTGISVQNTPNSLGYTTLHITGDGVNAAVNDKTSATTSYYYSTVQDLADLNRLTNTGGVLGSPVLLTLTGGDPGGDVNFLSPIALNRIDPTHIAVGGSTLGTPGYAVSVFTDDLVSTSFALTPRASAVAAAIIGSMSYGAVDAPNALLVGMSLVGGFTSKLWLTSDASTTNLAAVAGYPGAAIVSVMFDTRTKNRFFVIDGSETLWSTTNTGATFSNLTANLPANLLGTNSHRLSLEFLSSNGVNALFVGGLSNNGTLSSVCVADSDASGVLSNYRLFGIGLPNTMVNQISYNDKSDTLLASAYGRGSWLMYDVTSNFPQATQLQFGLANNDSTPDTSVLNNGIYPNRSLVKYGKGTLTISGTASNTGPTEVTAGTMIVNGTVLFSTITVDAGATLGGTGTTQDVILNGTISPGNPIGTLHVGAITFNSGSNYLVDLNNSSSDLIAAAGIVTINPGSTVTLTSPELTFPLSSYTIITSTMPIVVNGDFALVNPFRRFNFGLQYDPQDVKLLLLSINHFFAKGNARGAAKCYDAIFDDPSPDFEKVANLLYSQPTSQWQDSFNQMQPANFDDIAFAQENVAERIRQNFSAHLFEQRVESCPPQQPWRVWLAPFVEHVHQRGNSENKGYKENFRGVTAAADYQFKKHWALTGGFSFADSDVGIVHGRASGDFKTYAGSAGAIWANSHFFADGLFSYLFSSIHAKRKMHFTAPHVNSISRTAYHHQDSNQFMGHLGGGYDFKFKADSHGTVHVYPFVDVDYIFVKQDSYNEHGAKSLDLKVYAKKYDLLRPEGGIGIGYAGCFNSLNVNADVSASYIREQRFLGKKTKAHFEDGSCKFTVKGLNPENNLFSPTARITLTTTNATPISISLGYHGEFGAHFVENAGEGEIKIAF